MNSSEVRNHFLNYFASKGHTIVPSSSLVPADDPTVLFVNAGMVQFKKVFLGLERRDYRRATSSQKCLRVSGKHNDLEEVGPSPRHNTFFEMLGNFSFGDYFKEHAIEYAWEFLTSVIGLSPDRIWPTVYSDDDEGFQLWQDITGIPASRITRLGEKSNFWTMGDTGPCGPCSEIIYDRGPEKCTCHRPDCHLEYDDCDRWWELWNLVFMQFNLEPDGTLIPLSQPSIDTGMGLERLVSLIHGFDTIYDTDLFQPLINRIQELAGHSNDRRLANIAAYRAIADHSRSISFLIADGVMPGKAGHSYILRLLMRRAIRFGKKIGFTGPFLGEIANVAITTMASHYRELVEKRDFILQVIAQEEERFEQTLTAGINMLDRLIVDMEAKGQKVIPGDEVFRLYDTYGFPHMLTRDIAREHGVEIDEAGFNQAMAEQRQRSRAVEHFAPGQWEQVYRTLTLEPTRFLGYEKLEVDSHIVLLVRDYDQVEQVADGEEVEVLLAETPFYAESGGQVGDKGVIQGPKGRIVVEDTQEPGPQYIVHRGRVMEGYVRLGDQVVARVDGSRRLNIARNHTATHLLHKALREVLGSHAQQAGSLVAPDRLRFDFTHLEALTQEQLAEIEQVVNEKIRADLPVHTYTTSYRSAIEEGITALFGEKYGDQVRVVCIAEDQQTEQDKQTCYSKELCGGTHVERTGQIGVLYLVSESSIGTGMRRLEGVTGHGAELYAREQFALLDEIADRLQVSPELAADQVTLLTEELNEQRKLITRLQRQLAQTELSKLLDQVQIVNGATLLSAQVKATSYDMLREMSDWLRDRLDSAVIVLGAVVADKPAMVVAVTPDLVDRGVDAGHLAEQLGEFMGGSGGGRPTLAQAGGRDLDKLDEALDRALDILRKQLA